MLKLIMPNKGIIYDLGVDNPLSTLMREEGHEVYNTHGQDLDDDYNLSFSKNIDLVTGFEILEHLVSPYPLLKNLRSDKLFVTVPLKLWFSNAYRNREDIRDCHFHEFEDWQFDWLLEKSGWTIMDRVKFTHPAKKLGIRPLLRKFTPRYYLVYAERKS